jgi:hypothetical protein
MSRKGLHLKTHAEEISSKIRGPMNVRPQHYWFRRVATLTQVTPYFRRYRSADLRAFVLCERGLSFGSFACTFIPHYAGLLTEARFHERDS